MSETPPIHTELGRQRPFASPGQAAYLAMVLTTEQLRGEVADVLKTFGLTGPQYNLLRILMDGPARGMRAAEIEPRMIVRSSNVSRILPRLERDRLVRRGRAADDGRALLITPTQRARRVVADADEALRGLHERQFAGVRRELTQLQALLARLRRGQAARAGAGDPPSQRSPAASADATPAPRSRKTRKKKP